MTKNCNNDELYHYGVLGMKWGVRRAQKQLSRIDQKAKKRNWSDDAKEAAKIQTKKISQMSNTELNKLNNRKNLERNYKQLNPNAVKKGLRVAATVAGALGTVTALYTNSGKAISMGKGIGSKVLDKAGGLVLKGVDFKVRG